MNSKNKQKTQTNSKKKLSLSDLEYLTYRLTIIQKVVYIVLLYFRYKED